VVVGTETDRGLFVGALVAAGSQVDAVNPLAVSRDRDPHATSGAKSDAGDAKVLARTHQSLVWTRQRQLNQLRSLLRECYPGALAACGTDRGDRDALAVLQVAPTPPVGGVCHGPSWPRRSAGLAASPVEKAAPPTCRPSCAPPTAGARRGR
jgi:hypothetical protein